MNTAHRTARLAGKRRHGLLRGVAFGLLVSVLTGASLLCISALLLMQTNDPGKNASLLGFICLCITALVGGIASGKRNKGQGALAGLLLGGIWLLLLFVLSLFVKGESPSILYSLLTRLTLLLFALFGGIWGGSTSRRRRR